MKRDSISKLYCPKTKSSLYFGNNLEYVDGEIMSGSIFNETGHEYKIVNGIPDFAREEDLVGDAAFARAYYKGIAPTYDTNVDITFKLYNEDELDIRQQMIALLALKPHYKVLEISAGTGKDSELIANKLSHEGELFCFDLSLDMLAFAKKRLASTSVTTEVIGGTAVSLPFKTNYFDALYCFAGVGHFPDVGAALSEMARVVRPGGKVLFCEKNVPLWLRETTYGKILINNNPMFAKDVPLQSLPVEARDVCVRWINGNVHYVVDYRVGIGEPKGNFDLELPGARGGSFNTRYYGKLEGVTPKTKELALKARAKLGISMHKWLDETLSKEAQKVLNKDNS